jgi:hypothetical protein
MSVPAVAAAGLLVVVVVVVVVMVGRRAARRSNNCPIFIVQYVLSDMYIYESRVSMIAPHPPFLPTDNQTMVVVMVY